MMLQILFQSIPSILFEPVAVGAALGLVTAAVCFGKNKSALYWAVAFSLIFMLSWRLAIQIASSRYASILVFPATIATAYFAFKMDWIAAYIPKFPVLLRKYLPYLTVIGIAIGGVAQLLHYNPYADRFIKIAELIKADAKQFDKVHILTVDPRRTLYYTGFPVTAIASDGVTPDEYCKSLADTMLKGGGQYADMFYVIISESAKDLPGRCFSAVPDFIRKEFIFWREFYHNRKKRRVTRVYRYNWKNAYLFSVACAGQPLPQGKKIRTCTFEKTYPAGSWIYSRTSQKNSKESNVLQVPLLSNFPKEWQWVGTGGFRSGSNGELGAVVGENGRNVFRMKSDGLIAVFSPPAMKAQKYRVKITASGTPGSVFAFGAHYYAKKHCGFYTMPKMKIPGVGTWDFMLTQRYVPDGAEIMRIALQLYHGEIFIHSIELYEVDDKK